MRFSIRDLLWATAVVAMGLGWWLDRNDLIRRVDRLEMSQSLTDGLQKLKVRGEWRNDLFEEIEGIGQK